MAARGDEEQYYGCLIRMVEVHCDRILLLGTSHCSHFFHKEPPGATELQERLSTEFE